MALALAAARVPFPATTTVPPDSSAAAASAETTVPRAVRELLMSLASARACLSITGSPSIRPVGTDPSVDLDPAAARCRRSDPARSTKVNRLSCHGPTSRTQPGREDASNDCDLPCVPPCVLLLRPYLNPNPNPLPSSVSSLSSSSSSSSPATTLLLPSYRVPAPVPAPVRDSLHLLTTRRRTLTMKKECPLDEA